MLTTDVDLAARVLAAGTVVGSYELPDGTVINSYFDEYRVAADRDLLLQTGTALAALLPADVEVVAGLELGGVPFALAISWVTGLPVVLVRKAPKPYGTRGQVEGAVLAGRRVAMVDDVVRSGRQVLVAAEALAAAGGRPNTALAVLSRPGGARELLAGHGIALASALGDVPETMPATAKVG